MPRPVPALLAACALGLVAALPARAAPLEVEMRDAVGGLAGVATFAPLANGLLITVRLEGLPPGPHGFHIHGRGLCERPDFASAGGHFNPAGAAHGYDADDGREAGDLPNIHVGDDGTARVEILAPHLALSDDAESLGEGEAGGMLWSLRTAEGTAVMVHAEADDHRDAASAGARSACGVIAPPRG